MKIKTNCTVYLWLDNVCQIKMKVLKSRNQKVFKETKPKALFSYEKWKVLGTVALSFVCDKYYSIID